MGIFRGMIVGLLILWLTLPLPLFLSPEMVGDEFTDQPTVSVLLNQQKAKSPRMGFWHQINNKAKIFAWIKPTQLMSRVVFDDLLKTEKYIELALFHLWNSLVKPTRQILWQMTSQMQRSLMKNLAGAYSRSKFVLSFEDLIHQTEIVLDPEIS
ncbi:MULTISPECIES: hypothetical protein [Planktothricoides]|uniref:Uncharacterized protein n=2 Tax=Planktothricoides raciborskii TaxID=132608 RepID=A0AAU8JGZ9_9CYAN|nr:MULTISPECIES: hypothetical protein [Planktothricoides]KOR35177.1 hypothetical protein AM228_19875 [Planktothricoides sp. SR001]MBD2546173.1 hypothetical protein [Planktothricoides raciborskii FACHB-1370]MBD2583829.1 hypothetical protein [Planktothricoides raciborskii FACHB-1261]